MKTGRLAALAVALLALAAFAHAEGEQRYSELGDFTLESGEVIEDLKIGYRTFGELNADKSNAVLFPTWFTGTTADLVEWVGPGKLVDPSKHFVILVDAIGDGVSTSPSNSTTQPGMRFPRFTILDMVRSQHALLTRELGIGHLRAVMGVSMGGMQSFQWVVAYPGFVDRAVPIHGSPLLTSYDRFLWTATIRAIKADPAWNGGDYSSPPATGLKTVAAIVPLARSTRDAVVEETPPTEFAKLLGTLDEGIITGFDANNWIRQAEAMMALDVSAEFGGSMEKAAATVEADVLVVVGLRDHMVAPQPALDFAERLFAPVVELGGACGHLAIWCEEAEAFPVIARFLEE
jgi:homoserine O-acetyltransferase